MNIAPAISSFDNVSKIQNVQECLRDGRLLPIF